jgi:hypothetical protein
VLRFDSGSQPEKTFSGLALKYYLAITVPFMAITFILAYGIREFESRKAKLERASYDPELASLGAAMLAVNFGRHN